MLKQLKFKKSLNCTELFLNLVIIGRIRIVIIFNEFISGFLWNFLYTNTFSRLQCIVDLIKIGTDNH